MSLGGLLPDEDLTNQIFHVLDTHRYLLITASAGNESLDGAAFPAAIPGWFPSEQPILQVIDRFTVVLVDA